MIIRTACRLRPLAFNPRATHRCWMPLKAWSSPWHCKSVLLARLRSACATSGCHRARAERDCTHAPRRGPSCQVDVFLGRKSASGQAADFGRDLPLFRGPALRGLCRAVLGFGQLEGPPGAPREAVAAPQLPQHRAAPTPAAPTPAAPSRYCRGDRVFSKQGILGASSPYAYIVIA